MEASNPDRDGGLVLLIDDDVESRRHSRRLLELRGMEVVQASNGIAGLELIQRLPRSFRLVLTELDLPGVSGAVLLGTLRLFRPDLPVICLSGAKAGISAAGGCLAKPLQSSELHAALDASLRGDSVGWDPRFAEALNGPAAARARARFAVAGDLVEAAMELARVDRGA